MTISLRRPPELRVRRLAAILAGYSLLDSLVLLYPVYALLFADTGLSTWQISSLFVLWSLTGVVLEVPSGAWADAVSRRLLLGLGPLLSAVGFGLWVAVPAYWSFAAGFVLWGVKEALASGALEALVYSELDRVGAAGRYARIMGRARAAGMLGVVLAMALAAPVFAAGGYPAVGAASVLACLLTAALGFALPEHRAAARDSGPVAPDSGPAGGVAVDAVGGGAPPGAAEPAPDDGQLGYVAALRAGLAEARRSRPVRHAVLLLAVVSAVWGALDEYTPLLLRDDGVAPERVPLLLVLVWAAAALGGLLAGAGGRLPATGYAALLAGAAVALASGATIGGAAGIVLVAASFGVFQLASVVADARLQERIAGPSRATVTSLGGVATDLTTIGVYGTYGVLASLTGHATTFAAFAVPYLVIAYRLVRVHRAGPVEPDVRFGR
ncbi:MFS transporter [Micromonospora sp. NPDC049559]|uniref:MFS transporter n=1 Tax=Micromonospora sp. NPDC049559 TaxID=3155923 RepID=UPI003447568E